MPAKRGYPQSCANAHDSSLCGGVPPRKASPERGGARPRRAEGFRSPRCKGRGGSVSRRDLNQLARNRTHLAWAHKSEGKVKPIPNCSSGGSAREGLLSEKPPPSHYFNSNCSSGKGVWGRGASLREAASPPRISTLFHFLCDVSRYGYAGGAGLHQTAGDAGTVADSVKALDGGHEFVVNKKLAGVEFHLDTIEQRILAV